MGNPFVGEMVPGDTPRRRKLRVQTTLGENPRAGKLRANVNVCVELPRTSIAPAKNSTREWGNAAVVDRGSETMAEDFSGGRRTFDFRAAHE